MATQGDESLNSDSLSAVLHGDIVIVSVWERVLASFYDRRNV